MNHLSIDIETYSSENLAKCGVYRYAEAPDFEVLLFGYSADGVPVKVVDLTAGETLPADVRSALTDPAVTKWAFNAQFERVCLSRYLGYPTGQYLDPSSWHCTMVWAATLGLPLSLEGVGAVLGLEKQKLKEGKDLIRYFCAPAKAQDGSLIRHYPADAPEKWSLFKAYNLRDVETEMSIQQKIAEELGADYRTTRQGGIVLNDDNDINRRMVEHCYRTRKTMVNPIVDWTDEDVWAFLSHYGCKSNPLYECGFKRIGCIGCPMASRQLRLEEFRRYPSYQKAYIHAFDKMLEKRAAEGKPTTEKWSDGQAVFDWWLSG